MSRISLFPLLSLTLAAGVLHGNSPSAESVDVFEAGQDGYHTFRIPSIIRTADGHLLALCEGRKAGRSDTGDIDVVQRRSTDGGRSWGPLQVVWDDEANTCGNPCPVVDQTTGTVWLLLTWNAGDISEREVATGFGQDSRRVFVTNSTDGGETWAAPRDITVHTKAATWSWYATGPGAGIQIRHGVDAGRMVMPCDHKQPGRDGTDFYSHVIYSDDHGAHWQLGGRSPGAEVNESEVVELSDGRLLLNMRNYNREQRSRQICISEDGGLSWHSQRHDPALVSPTCQASLRRLRWPTPDAPGVIVFANPASPKDRVRLTVRASLDEASSWRYSRVLVAGSAAYSCLVALDNDDIGCLHERDKYQRITFARFPLQWLMAETNAE